MVALACVTAFAPQSSMPALRLRGAACSTAPKMAEKPPGEDILANLKKKVDDLPVEEIQDKLEELGKELIKQLEALSAKVKTQVEEMTSKLDDDKKAIAEKEEIAEQEDQIPQE